MLRSLVGSEMCIRDRFVFCTSVPIAAVQLTFCFDISQIRGPENWIKLRDEKPILSRIEQICAQFPYAVELKKPQLINATTNRHRVSTLYAALDIPEAERYVSILGITKVGKKLAGNRRLVIIDFAFACYKRVHRNLTYEHHMAYENHAFPFIQIPCEK